VEGMEAKERKRMGGRNRWRGIKEGEEDG